MHISAIIIVKILLLTKSSHALEYNKQQQKYNKNTDFLLHEGGINQNGNQKGNTVTQGPNSNLPQSHVNNQNADKRDYVAQFPLLRPPSSTSQTVAPTSGPQRNTQSSNGKRDYVAPQFPTLKPVQQNNKQSTASIGNFAASQFPALKPTQPNNNPSKIRDYVAPQFTTPKPQNNQGSTGAVKDLINFYDNKNKDHMAPNGKPSYSTMLQGHTNGPSSTTKFTQHPQPTSTTYTTKPISFSSIVSGSNKPSNQVTTPKPFSRPPHSTTASRPVSPILPSSIVNNNQGNANGNKPSDAELQILSEELLRKDSNNAARYITINYQEKTTSHSKEDKAPGPFITASPELWNIPTIQKFVPLLDNYVRDAMVNEHVTPQERTEENAFMDEIMSTPVIRHLMTFLKNKGYVTPDPRQQRDFVKQLWFGLYSRGKGKVGSSGFEHIFVSEINKRGEVSGLHNWIYFAKEEAANRINYLGYMKYLELNDKGVVIKMHFNQQGLDKPVNTLFVGTSPELEVALYTLCFVTRADDECKLKLGNKDVEITTHTFRYRSKNYIGSAYPSFNAL